MPSRERRLDARSKRFVTEAHRLRNRGHDRRAIVLYRRVLLEYPDDTDIALRLAPMLAHRGEGFEAWQLYRRAARKLARHKQWNDCLAVYRDACRFVPWEFEAWRLCAELQLKLGREDSALETLLEGRTHFREVQSRAQAIALLSRARSIEPWDADVVLDLASLYLKTDQTEVALELLACLATRAQGHHLRRTRALQMRITLAPRFAYLWLRSALAVEEPRREERHAGEGVRQRSPLSSKTSA